MSKKHSWRNKVWLVVSIIVAVMMVLLTVSPAFL